MDYSDFSKSMMQEVADTQAEIFVYASQQGYDMESFIENYMRSDFCNKEMDSIYSYFHGKPDTVCFSYIDDSSIKKHENGTADAIADPAWIGAVYRYMVLFSGIPSKEIIKKISPARLDELSLAYDCYECEDAAKDILNKFV